MKGSTIYIRVSASNYFDEIINFVITTDTADTIMATERLSSVLRHITPGKSPLDTM